MQEVGAYDTIQESRMENNVIDLNLNRQQILPNNCEYQVDKKCPECKRVIIQNNFVVQILPIETNTSL